MAATEPRIRAILVARSSAECSVPEVVKGHAEGTPKALPALAVTPPTKEGGPSQVPLVKELILLAGNVPHCRIIAIRYRGVPRAMPNASDCFRM